MESVEFIDPIEAADGLAQATKLFEESYGYKPTAVWAAPGRVNLIGEHTDYNAGLCLPIALPHCTFVAMSATDSTTARVVSGINPENVVSAELEGLQAGGVKGWAAYPVGVAWALRESGYDQVRGFDAAYVSCVPLGSGLSSSASLTCSTALALDGIFDLGFGSTDEGRVKLIDAAIASENKMAGASTGGLDQNASMRCTPGHAILLDCRPELTPQESVTQKLFDLESLGLELLVVDTQAPHQLSDGQYEKRRSRCESAAETLGVASLREVADKVNASEDPQKAMQEVLDRLDDEVTRKRVRHVITEIGRVNEFVEAFAQGDVKRSGDLFNASHESLRYDYEVTIPELDIAVEVAREMGAYGARMTGGGFGGSIIALVDKGRSAEIAQKIAERFAAESFHAPRALAAVAAQSARKVE